MLETLRHKSLDVTDLESNSRVTSVRVRVAIGHSRYSYSSFRKTPRVLIRLASYVIYDNQTKSEKSCRKEGMEVDVY